MTAIETFLGPVEPESLGPTLMHEHVFVLNAEMQGNFDLGWDEEERLADAVAKLTALHERGITAIVDPTVVGLGRYIPRVKKVAEQVPIKIVAATGLYTYNDIPFWFNGHFPGSGRNGGDPMVDLFVDDINHGIQGTDVKAGILKCATDHQGLTPGVERVLRACARAHRQTGVPITTHTHAGSEQGAAQQKVFAEEGVDLSHVVIGHSGDSTDLDYLKRLMDAGSSIGMDRFGINSILPFEQRVETVVKLCQQGYADRMVLAHDAACYIDWFDNRMLAAAAPQWNFNHISDDVLPELRQRGVSDGDIDAMLVANPARILQPVAAY